MISSIRRILRCASAGRAWSLPEIFPLSCAVVTSSTSVSRLLASQFRAFAIATKVLSFGVLKPHSMLLMYLVDISSSWESSACVSPRAFRASWIRLPTFCASTGILLTGSNLSVSILAGAPRENPPTERCISFRNIILRFLRAAGAGSDGDVRKMSQKEPSLMTHTCVFLLGCYNTKA